jgi:hypothetical protein
VREYYVTHNIDEQKVRNSAREESMTEPVQIHWHSRNSPCSGKHVLYQHGEVYSGEDNPAGIQGQ